MADRRDREQALLRTIQRRMSKPMGRIIALGPTVHDGREVCEGWAVVHRDDSFPEWDQVVELEQPLALGTAVDFAGDGRVRAFR